MTTPTKEEVLATWQKAAQVFRAYAAMLEPLTDDEIYKALSAYYLDDCTRRNTHPDYVKRMRAAIESFLAGRAK